MKYFDDSILIQQLIKEWRACSDSLRLTDINYRRKIEEELYARKYFDEQHDFPNARLE